MLVQVARDDAVLQHAAEGDAVAAGRPRQLARQREIRRQQHRSARDERQAALHQSGNRDPPARKRRAIQPGSTARAAPPAWRCGSRRRTRSGRTASIFRLSKSCSPCSDQDEQRQHRQAGKDVGQKHARKPWQRGGQDQHEARSRAAATAAAMSNTRSVSCRIHSVASAWIPRLIQNAKSSPKCR